MDSKEKLQHVLDNLINQKTEQAQIDFHEYLRARMQDVIHAHTTQNSDENEE